MRYKKKGRNTHHLRMHDVGIMGIMGAGNGSREGSHRLGGRATSLDRHGPKRIQEQDEPPPDPQERVWLSTNLGRHAPKKGGEGRATTRPHRRGYDRAKIIMR